ncbi:MAG: PQQ-dependent sugar dehydrogenase [Verrucomicrobia bacterium]|nr:PQQ-dependent sugar dehydrogenase [Verrucomicrobiota bacterium]
MNERRRTESLDVTPRSPRLRLGAPAVLATLLLWLAAIPSFAQPYGLASRPQIGPLLNNVMPEYVPAVSGNWSAVVAFSNLTFVNALGLCAVPGTSNLLCVWEREGRVYTFTNSPDVSNKTLVLNITNQCQGWDDSGLLGLAFHPGFATNRQMFVYYTWVTPGTVQGDPNTRPPTFKPTRDRLARFTLDTNGVALPGSETVFIDQNANSVWHNGGGMFFHPTNGFLYLTDGDDEDGNNPQRIDQNLFSGVLRIDVDQRGGAISHPPPRQPNSGSTSNYFIPNSNPWVGTNNALEEFYAIGLRSPHRMTHDPVSGRIFIGDVGAGAREEISVIEPTDPAGLNFQWDRIEGLNGDLTPPYPGVNKRPLHDYDHGVGQAVIGGYVYRGAEFAADLGGKYIFGDNVQKIIWVLDESASPTARIPLCVLPTGSGPNSGSDYTGLSSFGLDQNNEIFMCQMSSLGGRIFKLARTGSPPATRPMPALLSQTGAFTNLATLTANPGLLAYTVNSPLWSDGAVKSRWLSLPTNTTIGFAATGEWTFPQGTVFVKHFELPVDDRDPAVRRRLETRLLVLDTNGSAYGATYKWRADYSDADLLTNSLLEDLLITNTLGLLRTQQWYYPSRSDCLRCHTAAAGWVLGAKTRQQNGNFVFPTSGVTDNQLRAWNHVGLFSPALNEANLTNYDALVTVTNTSASLEFRVRSYLDANCAQCHRPGGVHAFWDARFDTPLAGAQIVNGIVQATLGISGAKIVAPQHVERSVMHVRDSSLDPAIKMPPLARNVTDTNAVNVLAAWIATLPLPTNSLPPPWAAQDIGGVAYAGDATFSAGTFSLAGSGDDIWNNADAFQFAYQPLTGNGQITARVLSVANTDAWAKSGVMIRETLDAGARHAFACVTVGNGVALQRRYDPGGGSDHTAGVNVVAPYWVRLLRSGNDFSGYSSPDGTNWTLIGVTTVGMGSNAFVGLALTSHNNGALNASAADNVTISGGVNQSPVAALAFPPSNTVFLAPANIPLAATASDPDGAVAKVEFFSGALKVATATNGPAYSATWSNVAAGTYPLAVIATDNLGSVSTPGAAANIFVTDPAGLSLKINFQTAASVTPSGYLADAGFAFGDRSNGWFYGWNGDNTANARERGATNSPDARYDTFNHLQKPASPDTWEIAVPNGRYSVRLVAGDPQNTDSVFRLALEGAFAMDATPDAGHLWADTTNVITVSDGRLTLSPASGASNAKICFLELTRLGAVPSVAGLTLSDGQARVTFDGAPGNIYVIEASTNLFNWLPLDTNISPGAPWLFVDPAGSNFLRRFYRGRGQ